jgi:hypothetical protein
MCAGGWSLDHLANRNLPFDTAWVQRLPPHLYEGSSVVSNDDLGKRERLQVAASVSQLFRL